VAYTYAFRDVRHAIGSRGSAVLESLIRQLPAINGAVFTGGIRCRFLLISPLPANDFGVINSILIGFGLISRHVGNCRPEPRQSTI